MSIASIAVTLGRSPCVAATIRRVGWLSIRSQADSADLRAALTQGMRELRWLEGKNVEYQFAFADGDAVRLDELAGELVARKVDVILSGGPPQTRAAQRATKTIPIVMAAGPKGVGKTLIRRPRVRNRCSSKTPYVAKNNLR